jgi:ankyrin repeat protein
MVGFPAVFFPLAFRNVEVFHAMVEKGADVQDRDASGSTSLMWAAFNEAGDPTLVKELLRMGVDPNLRTSRATPCMGRATATREAWLLSNKQALNPNGARQRSARSLYCKNQRHTSERQDASPATTISCRR